MLGYLFWQVLGGFSSKMEKEKEGSLFLRRVWGKGKDFSMI
jgi:hypothetical protein